MSSEQSRADGRLRTMDAGGDAVGLPPNNSVNLPIRPVTVRAFARPAPGRLAGYAER